MKESIKAELIVYLSPLLYLTIHCQNYKQLLDEVFVIAGIINVEESVINRAKGRG